MSTEEQPESGRGRRRVRMIVTVGVVAAVGFAAYVLWKRRQSRLIATPERRVSSKRPVLIINPGSGGGKAAKIDLVGSAANLEIKTIVRRKGQKPWALAKSAVDDGCDHLIIAGGDGSQARIAKAVVKRDVAFAVNRVGRHVGGVGRSTSEG